MEVEGREYVEFGVMPVAGCCFGFDRVGVVGAWCDDAVAVLVFKGRITIVVAESTVVYRGLGFLFSACSVVFRQGTGGVVQDTAESLRTVFGLWCFGVCEVYDVAGKIVAMSSNESGCLVDGFRAGV